MDRQKLMRITERSERMYLRFGKKGAEKDKFRSRRVGRGERKQGMQCILFRADFGGYLLPHRDIDNDEEQQGERGDPTANDESHGREQCLVHDLQRGDKTKHAS